MAATELPPEFDHWHPVLAARDLGTSPKRVELLGRGVALFRTGSGVGALLDRCPHRGMRLSRGIVADGCLRCPYHGYAFASDGAGASPGNAAMRIAATPFEVREAAGVLWIRRRGASTDFPQLVRAGARLVDRFVCTIEAPLEAVIDNFCEVEHTPTTHAYFGYALEAMAEVTHRSVATEDRVTVTNVGPQKPIPRLVRGLLGIGPRDTFIDHWVVRASPPHIAYEQWWRSPEGEPRPERLHIVVCFVPLSCHATDVWTFASLSRDGEPMPSSRPLIEALLRAFVRREVRLDRDMLEGLDDHRTSLAGRRLGRFDRPLGAYRRLLEARYRQRLTPHDGG